MLEARDSDEALAHASEEREGIDLLLSDVVMPRMIGRNPHRCICETVPGLLAVFMSGYTGDAIVQLGVLGDGVEFIQKPFRPRGLREKIRRVLDAQPD